MNRRRALILTAAGTLCLGPVLGGCSSRSSAPSTTIAPDLVGVLAANPQLTDAAQLLAYTQSDDVLKGISPHTVLAPTNAAVDAYAKSHGFADAKALVAAVKADPARAGAFVANFVAEGLVTAKDFPQNANETFTTMGGVDVTIEIESGVVKLRTAGGTATVTAVDLMTGSTAAHIVDIVLS